MKANFQVIEGGKVKAVTVRQADIIEAHGRWSRADQPISLARLAWELGMSQNTLAHEFLYIATEKAWRGGFQSGRASLWTKAAA